MALREILIDWLEVVDPDCTDALSPPEQRDFCADWYSEDVDPLYDAIVETLARTPSARHELLDAFRHGDFMQIGAVLDRILRGYLIGSDYVEGRMREVQEQEGRYEDSM